MMNQTRSSWWLFNVLRLTIEISVGERYVLNEINPTIGCLSFANACVSSLRREQHVSKIHKTGNVVIEEDDSQEIN